MPFLFLPDFFSKKDTGSLNGHRSSSAEKLCGLEEAPPGRVTSLQSSEPKKVALGLTCLGTGDGRQNLAMGRWFWKTVG